MVYHIIVNTRQEYFSRFNKPLNTCIVKTTGMANA